MFGTSGVRGRVGEQITADLALAVGRALATSGAERVVVGRDARGSGEFLGSALEAGLRECGCDVVGVGRASTPAVARAVRARDADAGVMITASHNPPEDNGFKLWNPSGQAFDEAQRAEISQIVDRDAPERRSWDELGGYTEWDGAESAHRDALVATGRDLSGVSAVVDVGNGMGGVTADALYELGADVSTLNAREDGRFPGRPSEPTAETCSGLCAATAGSNADLGIAHDGDADRMMAVDEHGAFLEGDTLLALFGRRAAASGDRVAAPLNTSLAVDDALSSVEASVTRTPVGDVYVAEQARDPGVVFGGEPSGAWIWPDETLCPDGPLAAVILAGLVAAEGSLSSLAAEIPDYPIERTSVAVADAEKSRVIGAVSDDIRATYDDVSTMDGVRVEVDDGWFLVRASGTQPLLRLTSQARSADRATELLGEVEALVERHS